MSLIDETLKFILAQGADLTGACSLQKIPVVVRKNFTVGFSIAVALDPAVVAGIVEGPTMEYYREYCWLNERLDAISSAAAAFTRAKGFAVDRWGATDDRIYGRHQTDLPHKTLATLSGLGWIGKCALLVTKEFGAAVRLTSLLAAIDEPVPDHSIVDSRCGSCTECVERCPAGAPKGGNWKQGTEREEIFDPDKCRAKARELAKARTGIECTFCGICIASCPWTKRYISASIHST
jgi:epoxyqueuosine reductase